MTKKPAGDLSSSTLGAATLLLLMAAALPAGADWLVLRNGDRAETKGGWQVKGKLVVFTAADGTLASLRLSEVDPAASERATAEAKAQAEKPAVPPPPPRKKSIRTLTDADFAHKPQPGEEEAGGGAAGEAKEEEAENEPKEEKSPVAVASWNQVNRTEGDGLDLVGAIRNSGKQLVTDVSLKVTVFDDAGSPVTTAMGILASTTLPPDGTTSFRVPLPTVFTFAKATFEIQNSTVELDPVSEEGEAEAPPSGRR